MTSRSATGCCQISLMKGIEFKFNAPFEKIEKQEDGILIIHLEGQDPIEADLLLWAVGRDAQHEGLGLDKVGVELGKNGAVMVDEDNQSSVPSIYAIGDVTDRIQLTPVAIREGQAFADTVFGNKPTRVDYANIPSAVFSHPPIAGVGMTESQARDKVGAYKTYVSDFRPMKNVLAGRNERALYKMIVDEETEQVRRHPHDRPRRAGNPPGRRDRGQGRPHQGPVRRDGRAAPDHVGRTGADAVT